MVLSSATRWGIIRFYSGVVRKKYFQMEDTFGHYWSGVILSCPIYQLLVHALMVVYIEISDLRLRTDPWIACTIQIWIIFLTFCTSFSEDCIWWKARMTTFNCHLHVTLRFATSSYFAALTDFNEHPPLPGRSTDNTTNSSTRFW